jgi:uncharacterized protein
MEDEVLLKFLSSIKPLKPGIKSIFLFGSRARKDFRPDSDYDLLVVTGKKDLELKDKLFDSAMDVLLSTGKYISLKVFPLEKFNHLSALSTVFMKNVLKEGIKVG